MSKELLDILSDRNKDLDSQKLLDYLNGKLSEQERHELEKMVGDNAFMNDAIEGLEHMRDKKKLQDYIEQLNAELHEQLQKPKDRRVKKKIKEYPWIYLAIVLILVL